MTLNPVLRIDTQMIEAVQAHQKRQRAGSARGRAREALGRVGIPSPDERLRAYPHQFSGGMRQRVAIAIALLNKPDLIIADEPTTALDVTIQAQILSEVQKLCRETGTALIWITHDLSVVAGLADEICVMYAGRIVEQGTVDDVLDAPLHPYTRGLIGSVPSRNRRGAPLAQIPGMTPSLARPAAGLRLPRRAARAPTSACIEEPQLRRAAPRRAQRCAASTPLLRPTAPDARAARRLQALRAAARPGRQDRAARSARDVSRRGRARGRRRDLAVARGRGGRAWSANPAAASRRSAAWSPASCRRAGARFRGRSATRRRARGARRRSRCR